MGMTEIIINEVQLGEKIKIQNEYLNNLKEDEDNYYGTEIYEEVFEDKDFKVEYHLQPNSLILVSQKKIN